MNFKHTLMKKTKILLSAFFTFCFVDHVQAQSHNSSTPNSGCKYANNGKDYEREGFVVCDACRKDEEKKRIAKQAEDKRQYELAMAKTKALQEANQKAFDEKQKREQEESKKGQSGEVLINGSSDAYKTQNPNIPANMSGNDPLEHFNNPQPTYSNDKTIEAVGQFSNAVSPLLEQWGNNLQQRREAEERRAAAEAVRIKEGAENNFKNLIKEYISAAEMGDDNARMILVSEYFRNISWGRDFTYLVPEAYDWIKEAAANKNLDAMNHMGACVYAAESYLKKNPFNGINSRMMAVKILEEAASLGSMDAMTMLGNYYDSKWMLYTGIGKEPSGADPEKAYYWYSKAAEAGSPSGNYYMGMILRYRSTGRFNGIKYKIEKNDTLSFEYFSKSISNPNFETSLFQQSKNSSEFGACFISGSYQELALMYEKGIGCKADKEIAKKLREET